ncbi:MAG: ACT domain-containing protein [Anaerolineales bacterium]
MSIFAVSTYQTDYVLVKQAALTDAVEALRAAGHKVEFAAG